MNNWPINDDTAELLERRMQAHPPKLALDVGSGRSTVIMARYADQVIALEHDNQYVRETAETLMQSAQNQIWVVVYAPIKQFNAGPWYDHDLRQDGPFDFVLIDGPPLKIGRQAGLRILWPHLAPGFEIWLDDWDRDHEKECVRNWQQHYPIKVEELSPTLVKITRE